MADYLIECLLQNPEGDDFLQSGFAAGYELAAWLKHLAKTSEGRAVLTDVASRLAVAYKAADPTTRNRIETGALEHALESRAVRPFFAAWGTDPTLRDAHEHEAYFGPKEDPDDRWASFYRQSGAAGWVGFSDVVLTIDRMDALVYYEGRCGSLYGVGEFVWLHRDSAESNWAIRKRILSWIS
jgi:hypothetical protein